jgi:hypothetical protein
MYKNDSIPTNNESEISITRESLIRDSDTKDSVTWDLVTRESLIRDSDTKDSVTWDLFARESITRI